MTQPGISSAGQFGLARTQWRNILGDLHQIFLISSLVFVAPSLSSSCCYPLLRPAVCWSVCVFLPMCVYVCEIKAGVWGQWEVSATGCVRVGVSDMLTLLPWASLQPSVSLLTGRGEDAEETTCSVFYSLFSLSLSHFFFPLHPSCCKWLAQLFSLGLGACGFSDLDRTAGTVQQKGATTVTLLLISGGCLMETPSLYSWERWNFLSLFKRSKAVTKCTVTGWYKCFVSVKKRFPSCCYAFQKKNLLNICVQKFVVVTFHLLYFLVM